ncbi:uncharacterized protein [Nicotiana tomentosiformis]|uniref:uncharacterized protein n=1 Tax=Nicotiana tomentosiformis TaxID=4098 RepID=UPI00388CB789
MENDAHKMDMVRQLVEQTHERRKEMENLKAAMKRMNAKVEEWVETFGDQQAADLVDIQEEPQIEEESEFRQEKTFEEEEILSQTWLMEQDKKLEIYEIQHEEVDASNAEQNSYELCDAENELIRQIEELKVESQSFDHIFVDDANVEKSALESCKKVNNVILEDSSVFAYEDVNSNKILELGRIGPHSKYFSILYLNDDMEIESFEHLEKSTVEEQRAYILEFVMPDR